MPSQVSMSFSAALVASKSVLVSEYISSESY